MDSEFDAEMVAVVTTFQRWLDARNDTCGWPRIAYRDATDADLAEYDASIAGEHAAALDAVDRILRGAQEG